MATGLSNNQAVVLLRMVRAALRDLLSKSGRKGCQWLFSSEQDLQASLYRLAYEACSQHIQSRNVWLGVEAQPTWFLHDLGKEFFQAFHFDDSITEVRDIIAKGIRSAGYSSRRKPRVDLALLARRKDAFPLLHVWETKFFSLGVSLTKTMWDCVLDAQRMVTFKKMLKPIMQLTGEVIWVDPYSSCKDGTWQGIRRRLLDWNRQYRGVPIRLWAYDNMGKVIRVGY
ncbi:MAG TPA: hypothetical protein VM389_09410 [Phycisphaerae bacterium]|nr:hypothetical protein [Phycisphaerae bacterium]